MYAAGKKEKKNEPRGERPVGCKAGTEVDDGGPAGAGTIKQEKRISRKNGRWAGEPARGRYYETLGALNSRPMVYNMEPLYATWDLCGRSIDAYCW